MIQFSYNFCVRCFEKEVYLTGVVCMVIIYLDVISIFNRKLLILIFVRHKRLRGGKPAGFLLYLLFRVFLFLNATGKNAFN